ncbi:hypothetical protein [Jannaschia sp. W003]|uniref:hypothetical protein n=1 Tax=Jannaschia sp. W003 TaxID=2867012 RepID=UPI0021A6DE20|nr:hypothetical protein [Jannaschia sp. W003]UWQ19984.1 hypothetical protein K3554_08110 [Jannaschia sp. W003]
MAIGAHFDTDIRKKTHLSDPEKIGLLYRLGIAVGAMMRALAPAGQRAPTPSLGQAPRNQAPEQHPGAGVSPAPASRTRASPVPAAQASWDVVRPLQADTPAPSLPAPVAPPTIAPFVALLQERDPLALERIEAEHAQRPKAPKIASLAAEARAVSGGMGEVAELLHACLPQIDDAVFLRGQITRLRRNEHYAHTDEAQICILDRLCQIDANNDRWLQSLYRVEARACARERPDNMTRPSAPTAPPEGGTPSTTRHRGEIDHG